MSRPASPKNPRRRCWEADQEKLWQPLVSSGLCPVKIMENILPLPHIFKFLTCQVPSPYSHIAVVQTFGQYCFPTVLFLTGQAVSHSCCLNTPHCVCCTGRGGNSSSAGSSERARRDAYPENRNTHVLCSIPLHLTSLLHSKSETL